MQTGYRHLEFHGCHHTASAILKGAIHHQRHGRVALRLGCEPVSLAKRGLQDMDKHRQQTCSGIKVHTENTASTFKCSKPKEAHVQDIQDIQVSLFLV